MIGEIRAKSILNRSSIGDYCINPYVGCQHACIYCYADYYTRRRGYRGPWGSYVYTKINAPELLSREILRKRRGVVYLSSMTDPYQQVEERYGLTKRILDILLRHQWPVLIQTKSPLVLRDLDVVRRFERASVGFTIITLDEELRSRFEPGAPPVSARIDALKQLKESGVSTFAFVGPILPGTDLEELMLLISEVKDYAELIYFDRLNLKPGLRAKIDGIFSDMGIPRWASNLDEYYRRVKRELSRALERKRIRYVFVY
ncbi:MAG: radical SAM protein [Candidatus Korarchaeota archaeon]|nr:radical SAM protein [Candidatus Korarchaeota archaeon]